MERRSDIGIDHQSIALFVVAVVLSFALTGAALWIGLR